MLCSGGHLLSLEKESKYPPLFTDTEVNNQLVDSILFCKPVNSAGYQSAQITLFTGLVHVYILM